jgi:acyl carrier protein
MGQDVRDRAHQLVAKQLGVAPEMVTDDATLVSDLGADSLDVVEFVMNVEETFGVEVTDDECDKVFSGTVADTVTLIESKLQ